MTVLFRCIATVLVTGLIVGFLWIGAANAQTAMQLPKPDESKIEELEKATQVREFEQWREGIPDYEFRLLERIDSLDTRASEIKILVLAGFSILFSLVIVIVYLVIRHDIGGARAPISRGWRGAQQKIVATVAGISRAKDRAPGDPKNPDKGAALQPQLTLRGKIIAVVTVVILSLIGGEIYLRNYDPRHSMVNVVPHVWEVSWCWNYTYKPGVYRTELPMPDGSRWNLSANRYGFRANHPVGRMDEINEVPASDTLRIVTIGASYTAGWGVDDVDAWPAQLERELNQTELLGKQVEVLNFAAPARGAFSNFIKGYLCDMHRFNPDIVLFEVEPVNQVDIPSPEALERFAGPEPDDWASNSPLFVDSNGYLRSFAPGMDIFKDLARESRLLATAIYQVYLLKLKLFEADTLQTSASLFDFVANSQDAMIKNVEFALSFFKDQGVLAIPVFRQRISPEAFEDAGYGRIDPIGDIVKNFEKRGLHSVNTATYLSDEVVDLIQGDSHWSPVGHKKVMQGVYDGLERLSPHIQSRAAITDYLDSLDLQSHAPSRGSSAN